MSKARKQAVPEPPERGDRGAQAPLPQRWALIGFIALCAASVGYAAGGAVVAISVCAAVVATLHRIVS